VSDVTNSCQLLKGLQALLYVDSKNNIGPSFLCLLFNNWAKINITVLRLFVLY